MKKPASLLIIFLLCLSVLTGCNNNELQDIHSPIYEVKEVTYQSGTYSFTVMAGINSPLYAITEDLHLFSQKEYGEPDEWTDIGKLKKTELTKDNFDDLFHGDGWVDGHSANSIRRNNANVWQLIYNQDCLYYVLQQKNGDLYLAYGYYDYSEKNDRYSDDTSIRWLFKLEAGAISNVGGASNEAASNSAKKLIELNQYSAMTVTGTTSIEVVYDYIKDEEATYDFVIEDKETIDKIMSEVFKVELKDYPDDRDIDIYQRWIVVKQGDSKYHIDLTLTSDGEKQYICQSKKLREIIETYIEDNTPTISNAKQ